MKKSATIVVPTFDFWRLRSELSMKFPKPEARVRSPLYGASLAGIKAVRRTGIREERSKWH